MQCLGLLAKQRLVLTARRQWRAVLPLVLRSGRLGHHGNGMKVRLATRNTSVAAGRCGAGADIDRMYGCGPAVVCAVKMIFVTTILAPLNGFHQNAHVAAGQPWNILLEMDTRW